MNRVYTRCGPTENAPVIPIWFTQFPIFRWDYHLNCRRCLVLSKNNRIIGKIKLFDTVNPGLTGAYLQKCKKETKLKEWEGNSSDYKYPVWLPLLEKWFVHIFVRKNRNVALFWATHFAQVLTKGIEKAIFVRCEKYIFGDFNYWAFHRSLLTNAIRFPW